MSKRATSLAVRSERFTKDGIYVLGYSVAEIGGSRPKRSDFHWIEAESGEIASPIFATEHEASYWQEGYELACVVVAEESHADAA